MDVLVENKPLVLVNYLKGGLGNQLFQHVFACSLAKKLNAELIADVSYFAFDPYGFDAHILKFATSTQRGVIGDYAGEGCYMLQEGQFLHLQDHLAMPGNAKALFLTGYWQRESLLDPVVVRETYEQLRKFAQELVSAELISGISNCKNSVGVHIRRRDYGHMGVCKDSYYIAAIRHLLINYPDAELFVFSDEPNYAKHLLNFAGINFNLISSGSDVGDLFLMSLCRHFVIANSSYSWWGAYFAEYKEGVIFCPKEWVTIDATPSPCPSRWNQIENAIVPFSINEVEIDSLFKQAQKKRFDNDIVRWFSCSGDKTLRVEFDDLNENSVVFDLGGYKGDWSSEIYSRYGSNVYVFEPIKTFYEQINARFEDVASIHSYQFGLGARDEQLEFHLSADGTGYFGAAGTLEIAKIHSANGFLAENGIREIDLMKINIEGGEYDLLEHLIDTGLIFNIKRLQVQFHDFVPHAIERRAAIVQRLAKTHKMNWSFYFVWEEWVLF